MNSEMTRRCDSVACTAKIGLKRAFFALAVAALTCGLASVPEVTVLTTVQDPSTRLVTITYRLEAADGIVTPSVQTNRGDDVWVDIGDEHLTHFDGDVNRRVTATSGGEVRTITWRPDKAWPDQKITANNLRIGLKAWSLTAPPDYMVVNLAVQNPVVRYYASAAALPSGGVTSDVYKTDCLVLRKIPAGNVVWRMGSPDTEPGRGGTSGPDETAFEITLPQDYYIGVYEMTQRQYELVTGLRPAYASRAEFYAMRPVETVSYNDIRGAVEDDIDWPSTGNAVLPASFLGILRARTGLSGLDLPTAAQWEFACRAGCGNGYYNGTDYSGTGNTAVGLDPIARYNIWDISGAGTADLSRLTGIVGCCEPNRWGLYDMLGNVWEWCRDWYAAAGVRTADTALNGCTIDDAILYKGNASREYRGSSFNLAASWCRCAARNYDNPTMAHWGTGFRVMCSVDGQ